MSEGFLGPGEWVGPFPRIRSSWRLKKATREFIKDCMGLGAQDVVVGDEAHTRGGRAALSREIETLNIF